MSDTDVGGFSRGDTGRPPAPVYSPLDEPTPDRRGALWLGGVVATLLHAALAGGGARLGAMPLRSVPPEPTQVTEMVEVPIEIEPPPAPPPPVESPEPEREPEPEPERAPPPPPAKPAPTTPPPPPAAAPAAAEAAQVLTREAQAEEIVDFGDTFVQGKGVTYAGGISARTGSSRVAARDPGARALGVVGGTGTDESGVDRSRAPALAGGAAWDCPFPREAEFNGIDQAVVTLSVRVSREGSVQDVTIERDPGSGFGREAQRCARSKRWAPGLDRAGNAVAMTSRVNVRFVR